MNTSPKSAGVHLRLVLWKANHAIEKVERLSIASTGLCLSDFTVLEVLLHKGPLPINTVGRKVLLTSGSITLAVDRLARKGLVERAPYDKDRRVIRVQLTDAGRALIEKAFHEHSKRLEEVMEPMSEDEQKLVEECLKKVGRHAEHLSDTYKPS
ncbi:MAG: MarR family winged helix-turn-helix transcriptional regulator [Verrucomicrobiales bacterium]